MFSASFPPYEDRKLGAQDIRRIMKRVMRYPNIYTLFSEYFPQVKESEILSNIVAFYACQGGAYYNRTLNRLDECLANFKISSSKKRYKECLERLFSVDYDISTAVLDELEVAHYLASKFGYPNVDLYPKLANGKRSDVVLSFGDTPKKVYFEVGGLRENKAEAAIQKVLSKASEAFFKILKPDYYLHVDVRVNKFARSTSGHIDIEKSASLLESFLEHRDIQDFLRGDSEPFLFESSKPIKSLVKLSLAELERPHRISRDKSTDKVLPRVTLAASPAYESQDFDNQRMSFAKQMQRHIDRQIKEEKQIQVGERNIVLVKGSSASTFSYFRGSTVLGIEHLIAPISNWMKESGEPNLSGVAFYDTYVERALYFNNGKANNTSKISREDIERMGFTWVNSKCAHIARKDEREWSRWKRKHPKYREHTETFPW